MGDHRNLQVPFILFVALLFLAPYFYFGQDMAYVIHDSLDSSVSHFVVMKKEQKLFSFSNDIYMESVMGGTLPRNAMQNGSNIIPVLYAIFPPFTAFIIAKFLCHLIAFIGAFLLARKHILQKLSGAWPSLLLATCFSFLPFYHIYGCAAVSGTALTAYAFLELWKGRSGLWPFFILFTAPFFGSLVLVGFAVISVAGFAWIASLVKQRFRRRFLSGILLYGTCSLLSSANLILLFFGNENFVSHRSNFEPANMDWNDAILLATKQLVGGQYHAESAHYFVLLLTIVLITAGLFSRRIRTRSYRWICLVAGIAFAIAVLRGFWNLNILNELKDHLSILKTFQFDRFYMLYPLLWLVVLGLIFRFIKEHLTPRNFAWSIAGIFLIQLSIAIHANKEYVGGIMRFVGIEYSEQPSYRAFYDEELFQEIRSDIGQSVGNHKVVSLGLYPNIAHYNGFKVLDSYQANYALNYKKRFRRFIAPELEKDPAIRKYFDGWGGRCYAWSAELGFNNYPNKWNETAVNSLNWNMQAFTALGGRLVLSAVPIENATELDLRLKGIYKGEWWRIFLYEHTPVQFTHKKSP